MIFPAVPVRLAPNGSSLHRFPVSYSSFSTPDIRLLGYHITFWRFVNRDMHRQNVADAEPPPAKPVAGRCPLYVGSSGQPRKRRSSEFPAAAGKAPAVDGGAAVEDAAAGAGAVIGFEGRS